MVVECSVGFGRRLRVHGVDNDTYEVSISVDGKNTMICKLDDDVDGTYFMYNGSRIYLNDMNQVD